MTSILKQRTRRPTPKIVEIKTQSSIFTKEDTPDAHGTIAKIKKATKSDTRQTSMNRYFTSPRKRLGSTTKNFRFEESTQYITPVAPTRITVNKVKIEKTIHKTTKNPIETHQSTAKPVCFSQCSENAECKNVNGQSKCICMEGFIGNGTSCRGNIPPCEIQTGNSIGQFWLRFLCQLNGFGMLSPDCKIRVIVGTS